MIFMIRQRRHGWLYELLSILFGLYIIAVLDAVFFPIMIPDNWPANLNAADTRRALQQVNWIPFHFGSPISSSAYAEANMQRFRWFDIIGNILLTIPLGFGLTYFVPLKPRAIVWVAWQLEYFLKEHNCLSTGVRVVYYGRNQRLIWNGSGYCWVI
jgi:glycopeptide antibiotics resistance protein